MAANPQMVIRVAGSVAELRKNILEGKANIEALSASVEKYANNWTKHSATLSQDARNIVAAVLKVGAATLTAGDSAKALRTLDAAMVQLRIAGQPIPALMSSTAAQLRALHPAATQAATSMATLREGLGTLGIGLGVGAGVMGIQRFIGAIMDLGDQIQKTADKTGMNAEEVQRLSHIAQQTGSSLDTMASAAQNLQQRLGDGDAGASGAMAKLGIKAEAFLQLGTYQQMVTLSEAIRGVEDPTLRAAIAADLFGKTWKEIMPAVMSDMDALGESAAVMSAATVESLDRAGDAWEAFKTSTKVGVAELWDWMVEKTANSFDAMTRVAEGKTGVLEGYMRMWLGLRGDLSLELPNVKRPTPNVGATSVALSMAEADKAAKRLNETIEKQIALSTKAAAEAKKLREEWENLVEKIYTQEHQYDADNLLRDIFFNTKTWDEVAKDLPPYIVEAIRSSVAKAQAELDAGEPFDIASILTGNAGNEAAPTGVLLAQATAAWEQYGEAAVYALMSIADAAGVANDQLVQFVATFASGMARGQSAQDSFATSAIQLILRMAQDYSAVGNSIEALRADFITSAGGLDALASAANRAGISLDDLYSAETVFDMQMAIARITAQLEDQNILLVAAVDLYSTIRDLQNQLDDAIANSIPDWQTIAAIMEKYGIDLDHAGAAIQQMASNAQAMALMTVWQDWQAALGDMAALAAGMQDDMLQFVLNAIQYSLTIPANMKPIIDALAAAGLLIGADGQPIDISTLVYGPELQTAQEANTEAILSLTNAINFLTLQLMQAAGYSNQNTGQWSGFGAGFGNISLNDPYLAGLGNSATWAYLQAWLAYYNQYGVAPPAGTQPPWDPPQQQGFAQGTGGLVDFGAGTPTTLHGLEAVVTAQQLRNLLNGSGGGGGTVNIAIQAWDGNSVDDWLRRGGDRQLAEAVVSSVPGELRRLKLM
jgi:hypothetical protein